MRLRSSKLTAALLLAACSTALGVDQGGLHAAAEQLLRMYPGTAIHKDQDRVRIIYGMPMTPGLDARAAAKAFIQMHGEAFGCGPLSVREDWATAFADGSKIVLCYQQYLNGLPVEYGCLKVLVLNGPVPRVVYAAGTLAPMPGDGGFPEAKLDGATAVQLVQAMPQWRRLPVWSAPQKVVFQGNGDWRSPVIAWKFTGESSIPSDKLHKTFFVDAATGKIVHVRDEVVYDDVQGSIRGVGSPGLYPDAPYNPPALINIPGMRAVISGGGSSYSDTGGLFTIANPGTSLVTVSCGVNGSGAGQWVNVVPTGIGAISASIDATPPGPADLVLNPSPAEQLTAQVNAFAAATVTHNFIKTHAPGLTRWDIPIPCNTGVAGACNAFFTVGTAGPSINFFNSGTNGVNTCPNSAYTTIVSHEYGHFIVNRLGPNGSGLAQNAFGEGYGDTNAELIWDDGVTGRGFFGTQVSFVRDPIGANIQYPCSNAQCAGTEIHCCGQVISGVWWRTRTAMGLAVGEPAGLNLTRQLEVNWALITTGGPDSSNSAGPGTAIEVLTADDDDGNISNGSPNYIRICPSFAAHGIQCPAIAPIGFEYPAGRPTQVTPGEPAPFPVNIVGYAGTPQPGTATMTYRTDGGSFTTIPLTQGAPNQYTATIPPSACGQYVEYYLSARSTGMATASDPSDAPASLFGALAVAGHASTTIADVNFETDPGWTVTDTAISTGTWMRGIPVGPSPTAPTADFDGSGQCWTTDNRIGVGTGAFDVDGGPTVLTTGAYDLSAYAAATVSYARWMVCSGGVADTMLFQVSGDNGGTWQTLETASNAVGWQPKAFNVPILSPQVRFRWSVADNPNDSVTEAGVDAFRLVGYTCAPVPCYANCDGSTAAPILNVNDFGCFLNRFAAGDPYANCDGSTTSPTLNVNDFSCFLNRFAGGCT